MRVALIAIVVACGGAPNPTPVETPSVLYTAPVDAMVVAIADAAEPVAIDAATAAVIIDAPPPPATLTFDPRPPVKGAVTKIAVHQTVTVGGVTVKFTSNGHKHAVDGDTLGMWGFELARGAKQEMELRSEDQHFEAEVDAKGVLLVFRHVDYSTFEIVLAAARTPKPLDEDACVALIEKVATTKGLPDGTNGYSSTHGFVVAHSERWYGHCGTYTRRVWFTERRVPTKRPRR